jgi:hypothetical protein
LQLHLTASELRRSVSWIILDATPQPLRYATKSSKSA